MANKTKIIKLSVLISVLTLILAVIVTVITMALVKVNLNPKIDLTNAQGMKIYNSSSSYSKDYAKDSEEYNKILNAYENSFKTSYLNSLANGYNKEKYEISACSDSISTLQSNSKFSIQLDFSPAIAPKYLKNPDGSYYKISTTQVKYSSVLIVVNEDNANFGDVEIYFTTATSSATASYKITAHANYEKLINTITEILNN